MGTEKRHLRISDRPTGIVLAEGAKGWDVTPFEGNFYIRSHCLNGKVFKRNHIPGICPYKGLYVWLDLQLPQRAVVKSLGWSYWLPNPQFPFIWFRVALPGSYPDLLVEEFTA